MLLGEHRHISGKWRGNGDEWIERIKLSFENLSFIGIILRIHPQSRSPLQFQFARI